MGKQKSIQWLSGFAGLVCVFTTSPCMASTSGFQEPVKADIHESSASDLILAPFEREPRSALTTHTHLQYSGDKYYDALAVRFARDWLDARAYEEQGDALQTRSGQEAVIGQGQDGQRVVLSLFNPEKPNLALSSQIPNLVELGLDIPGYGYRQDTVSAVGLRYEWALDTPGGRDGLDVGWTPRAGVALADGGRATQTGATVRLGQYLNVETDVRPAWYFFAGADQTAVVYDAGEGLDVRSAFSMNSHAIVGDAQAGLAMRFGDADISVAYIHRETSYSLPNASWDTTEGFGAFTLTWRR